MKKIVFFLIATFCLLLVGCETHCDVRPTNCINITAIRNQACGKIGVIRFKALNETATLVGAQGGLAWRSEQINCVLKKQQMKLDEIYNFRALMLKDDIRPPVLEEGREDLTLGDCALATPDCPGCCRTIRAADQILRIVCPPCFVSAPPNWRDYLWMRFCQPQQPDVTLLPKTIEEAGAWNCFVKQGWQQGIEQANQIFAENLLRLRRDYNGMVLYRKLLAQNMVTPPYVAKTDLGVTGDGNELRINDRVLTIAATSRLNTNPDTWKPAVGRPSNCCCEEEPPPLPCAPIPPVKKCVKVRKCVKKIPKPRPVKRKKCVKTRY